MLEDVTSLLDKFFLLLVAWVAMDFKVEFGFCNDVSGIDEPDSKFAGEDSFGSRRHGVCV